jgi:hypothetical protein
VSFDQVDERPPPDGDRRPPGAVRRYSCHGTPPTDATIMSNTIERNVTGYGGERIIAQAPWRGLLPCRAG